MINRRLPYAATIWAKFASKYAVNKKQMERAQRFKAIRLTRSYRTVTGEAVLAITSTVPADMIAQERADRYWSA